VCLEDAVDVDLFRFSLRSLFQRAHGLVRRVFIVNAFGDPLPQWLNQKHPAVNKKSVCFSINQFAKFLSSKKVRVVDPKALRKLVPTFPLKGASTEMVKYLVHTIPTLSDPFVVIDTNYVFRQHNLTINEFVGFQLQRTLHWTTQDRVSPDGKKTNGNCISSRTTAAALEIRKTYYQIWSSLNIYARAPVVVSRYVFLY
jgi:hypothetical protein